MISRDFLKELLLYDPETGWFTNRYSRGRAAEGERAGSPSGHGYRKIVVNYTKYYEHHLAWLYIYDEWPDEIDHINGDGSDNRIANLRLCDRSQNNFNARTIPGQAGLSGAYLDRRNHTWYSKIQVGGQQIFLGNFNSPEEAHEAYMAVREELAGEFAYHNRPERT
jgi:HNH endonuclease